MRTLSWNDLFIQDPSIDVAQLLSEWRPPRVIGPVQPIGLSAFGDVYFLRPDGSVHVLDGFEGEVRLAAHSDEEFAAYMKSASWQDANLMPAVIQQLHARGLALGPGQVFGFAPHPALVGKIKPEGALVLSARAWHSICSQTLGPRGSTAA